MGKKGIILKNKTYISFSGLNINPAAGIKQQSIIQGYPPLIGLYQTGNTL